MGSGLVDISLCAFWCRSVSEICFKVSSSPRATVDFARLGGGSSETSTSLRFGGQSTVFSFVTWRLVIGLVTLDETALAGTALALDLAEDLVLTGDLASRGTAFTGTFLGFVIFFGRDFVGVLSTSEMSGTTPKRVGVLRERTERRRDKLVSLGVVGGVHMVAACELMFAPMDSGVIGGLGADSDKFVPTNSIAPDVVSVVGVVSISGEARPDIVRVEGADISLLRNLQALRVKNLNNNSLWQLLTVPPNL